MQPRAFHVRRGLRTATALGFTLLEMVVVVVAVVILVAILVPSLSRARSQAGRLACASNLRAMGQALNLIRVERGRYPWRDQSAPDPPTFDALANIGKPLAKALVSGALGRPELMFCPTSMARDLQAKKPYDLDPSTGKLSKTWENGQISYIYLPGTQNPFRSPPTDPDGAPTFTKELETPDISRSPRLVLAGDRTVECAPGSKVAGSNHGREGGWFCFTTGDVQWWPWERLTAHPAKRKPPDFYIWYWPKMSQQVACN
jgi:type II secretory pathway pseudopilin PulG